MSSWRRPPSGTEPEALLIKYQELLRKHEALVHKLERRTEEHVSTWKLSTWGLETTASGLALLHGSVLQIANRRWRELAALPGRWHTLEAPTRGLSLREVAQEEALHVLGQDKRPRVTRYLRGEEQVLEVRAEWMAGPPAQRMLVMALDITEQVQGENELRRARQELIQREHLRGLGELVSGITHDLTNTLRAMSLRLELIQRDHDFAARQQGNLDALVRIVTDANKRLDHLSDFSRQKPEQSLTEQVQLADVAREAAEIARDDIEHRAALEGLVLRVRVEVSALPLVRGSAMDLRYVLINLLLNARDAMPQGGTIHLRGGYSEGQVWLCVEDEGTGIPEQHLPSLFRPFFTTKGTRGTGLGLSMAYGVLARAGGRITAANRAQGGACFTLFLPPVLPPPAPAPPRVKRPASKAVRRPRKARPSRRGNPPATGPAGGRRGD